METLWTIKGGENIRPVRNTRENVHLINVVARQTQCTHTVSALFLRHLYELVGRHGARARTGVHIHGRFTALCVQTVEFTAKLVHFVAQLNYPSDSGKVVSAISGNVARERFDEVRHRNSCSRYPGKIRLPAFAILRSLFIHPQSLASLPVIGRRNIAGLREKGVDVREPAIPG